MQTAAGAGMDPTAYQQYMDPYLEDVVQRAQSDIGRQGEIQQQAAAAKAVGSGAFGGSRAAVLQGEIGRNVLEQQARTGERLRSAGFAQASKLAQDAAQQQLRQAQRRCAGTGALLLVVRHKQWVCRTSHTSRYRRAATAAGTDWSQHRSAEPACPAAASVPADRLLSDIFRGVPPTATTSTTTTPGPAPRLNFLVSVLLVWVPLALLVVSVIC